MGIRTPDPDLAKVVLYQLSYAPIGWVEPAQLLPQLVVAVAELVGLSGFEPETSRLSGVCSNQLSYKPSVGSVARRHGATWLGHATPDDPVSSQDLSNRISYGCIGRSRSAARAGYDMDPSTPARVSGWLAGLPLVRRGRRLGAVSS